MSIYCQAIEIPHVVHMRIAPVIGGSAVVRPSPGAPRGAARTAGDGPRGVALRLKPLSFQWTVPSTAPSTRTRKAANQRPGEAASLALHRDSFGHTTHWPTTTDWKVGGSSPSERADYTSGTRAEGSRTLLAFERPPWPAAPPSRMYRWRQSFLVRQAFPGVWQALESRPIRSTGCCRNDNVRPHLPWSRRGV